MLRLKSVGIAVAILCSLCLFGMVFPPLVSAQLAIDDHAAEIVNASAYVSIDSLSYDGSGEGVVNVSGSFSLYNYDQKRGLSYEGELRLEIFDSDGNTYTPHALLPVGGSVKKNDEDAHLWEVFTNFSESTQLHMSCLSGPKPIESGERYRADANIALRVEGLHKKETWAKPYSYEFWHEPTEDVALQVGIGPTTTEDGETFSDDCFVDSAGERAEWHSLVYTDTPYDTIYWYVKAPGDTSADGSLEAVTFGDGVTRKSTMTTDFRDVVDGNNWAWHEITAYVYRWDQTVYSTSYLVGVKSK